MTIDWLQFTPLNAALGGLLIGTAAALLIMFNGRIAGISGILGNLLRPRRPNDIGWRIAFIGGLCAAPFCVSLFFPLPDLHIHSSTLTLMSSGLLVGFGTRYGSGCTSGHGICGLSRFSPRSIVATLLFMTAGFVTVFVTHHLLS